MMWVQSVFNMKDKLQWLKRVRSEDASPLLYTYSDHRNGLQLCEEVFFKNISFACNKTTL